MPNISNSIVFTIKTVGNPYLRVFPTNFLVGNILIVLA